MHIESPIRKIQVNTLMFFLAHIGPKDIKNNIVAKKTTELVLLFHKKTTKLVFFWPNMGQKNIKVLINYKLTNIWS